MTRIGREATDLQKVERGKRTRKTNQYAAAEFDRKLNRKNDACA